MKKIGRRSVVRMGVVRRVSHYEQAAARVDVLELARDIMVRDLARQRGRSQGRQVALRPAGDITVTSRDDSLCQSIVLAMRQPWLVAFVGRRNRRGQSAK